MNIIIEVRGGIVSGVFKQGRWTKRLPDIVVVDLDGEQVGTKCEPCWWTLMPLSEAERKTQKILKS